MTNNNNDYGYGYGNDCAYDDDLGLEKVVEILKDGGVVIAPTDTVYGFLADARNEAAVGRIFEIKKRSVEKVLPVFVKNIEMVKRYMKPFDQAQGIKVKKFLEAVWPGAVTVILGIKETKLLSSMVIQNRTVGVRVSAHPFIKKIFEQIDFPLAQSSVNIAGEEPVRSAVEAEKVFQNLEFQPDLIIDGGIITGSSSTVVDLSGGEPKILREGAMSKNQIFRLFRKAGLM